jgi:hypothetical protein
MATDDAVFVHIGLPKTGTTYLQHMLWHNRRRLAEVGYLYPGKNQRAHWAAAMDLRGSGADQPGVPGAWPALAESVRAWDGPAIISHELLAGSRLRHIETAMESLAPRQVHVIVTLRDFSRIVPATWQERAKNTQVETWESFLEDVAKGPDGGHRFWALQNVPRTLQRWGSAVPGERLHVVTVPPLGEDPDLLLGRFCSVLGLDLEVFAQAPPRANESIGAVEVAVLQQVNLAAHDRLDLDAYRRLVKHHLVPDMLASRQGQRRIVLPEWCRGWVEEETTRVRGAVEAQECHVVGDLAELEPKAFGEVDARSTSAPDHISDREVLRASAEVVVDLLEEVRGLRQDLRAARRRLARQPPPPPAPPPPPPPPPPPGLPRRALRRARLLLHRLRRAWRAGRL